MTAPVGLLSGVVQRAARSITFVTVVGWDNMTRWEAPLTSTIFAPARLAMKRSAAGAIAWSPVGMTAYFGSAAGAVRSIGSVKAEAATGRWAATNDVGLAGRDVRGEDRAGGLGLDREVDPTGIGDHVVVSGPRSLPGNCEFSAPSVSPACGMNAAT